MSIPSWIIVTILKTLGPEIIQRIFDAIIEWAERQKAKDDGDIRQDSSNPNNGDADNNGFPDIIEDL